MTKHKKLSKGVSLLLIFVLVFCSISSMHLSNAYAASDNSTTLLSNVSNNATGQITFTFKVPAGYTGYYEVLPKTSKIIHGSQSVINTDVDKITGTVNNKTGTATKTVTLTKNVKFYGDYVVRVGLGGYYNSSASVRQSATVKSTMVGTNTKKVTWQWTSTRKSNYDANKTVTINADMTAGINLAQFLLTLNPATKILGITLSVVGTPILHTNAKMAEAYSMFDNLAVGNYVGFYITESTDSTNFKIYLATFNSSKAVTNQMLLKTVYHSNYPYIF